jgi:hypothetical protein
MCCSVAAAAAAAEVLGRPHSISLLFLNDLPPVCHWFAMLFAGLWESVDAAGAVRGYCEFSSSNSFCMMVCCACQGQQSRAFVSLISKGSML